MKKLNGNIYLKIEEIEKEVDSIKKRFRTSQGTTPSCVRYIDVEFIEKIHNESKNLCASMNYLFGYGEEYTLLRLVIHKIQERFREQDSCKDTLQFMQYDLSQTQRRAYRLQYENFLVNIFLEECIIKFKKLS
tara:strand:- start:314 stop:712 length:399 start_codon:yes stop_codon:yes gene_type:complete